MLIIPIPADNQIRVSVEGEPAITLADFFAINATEDENNDLVADMIGDLRTMPIGEITFVGICEVKRVA